MHQQALTAAIGFISQLEADVATGAALDGKNTSPKKLTTQDGRHFQRSNN